MYNLVICYENDSKRGTQGFLGDANKNFAKKSALIPKHVEFNLLCNESKNSYGDNGYTIYCEDQVHRRLVWM